MLNDIGKIAQPSSEDLARNLVTDLNTCERADCGPWEVDEFCKLKQPEHWHFEPIFNKGGYQIATVWRPDDDEIHWNDVFIVNARVGWPAAIRRALAAEAQVVELQARIAELEGRAK